MKKFLNKDNKLHFIGIGGYGMSALAKILLETGYSLSGSDIKKSSITDKLQKLGAELCIGHSEKNVGEAKAVIYSACISADNPELAVARQKDIPVFHRAELLAELMNEKTGIAVAGAHGKTTTTTLISLLLKQLNFDPTVVIGAKVDNLGDGARAGSGNFVVAEADESDGSFLFLRPTYAVITNIDLEHLDYYKNLKEIKKTYFQFIERLKGEGKLFYCADDAHLKEMLRTYRKKTMSFGINKENDIYPVDIEFEGLKSKFSVVFQGKNLGRVVLNSPGEHNIVNCLGAIGLALDLGIKFGKIKEALEFFQPPHRRCQVVADFENIKVIDDYAHHPTEIKATLKSVKNIRAKRIIAIFQPHRYSRTKHLKDLFIESFKDADYLILTDIYSASEKPIEGISSEILIDEIRAKGAREAHFIPKQKITSHLLNIVEDGDVVLILGAGDVTEIAAEFSRELKNRLSV